MSESIKTPANEAIFSQLRVLIIDDNSVDREMLRIHLEDLGFKGIQEARSGSEGIFKCENSVKVEKPFHLVITDWKMPEKDGMALLKFLKGSKDFRKTRVIMITSVNEEEQVKNAIIAGVDDFILKPINPTILHQKVEKLLKLKHD